MANQYSLTIRVEDLNGTTAAEDALNRANGKNDEKAEKLTPEEKQRVKQTAAATSLFVDGLKSTAIDIGTSTISTIGVLSTDTAFQNTITNTISTGSSLISTATTIAAGAAVGGPVGAAVAAVVEVASYVIKLTTSAIKYEQERLIESIQIKDKAERIGALSSDRNRR